MWIKVLKYAAKGAIALGLDQKIKGWLGKRLQKAATKVKGKLEKHKDELEEIKQVARDNGLLE